jgi:hypothetical protein
MTRNYVYACAQRQIWRIQEIIERTTNTDSEDTNNLGYLLDSLMGVRAAGGVC